MKIFKTKYTVYTTAPNPDPIYFQLKRHGWFQKTKWLDPKGYEWFSRESNTKYWTSLAEVEAFIIKEQARFRYNKWLKLKEYS